MITIVPCVDHQIGFECLLHLLKLEVEKKLYIPYVITTKQNNEGWWQSIFELKMNKQIVYFEDYQIPENLIAPDYLLLLSWKYLLNKNWINFPNKFCINLHYSLLPKNRGTYPVNWSIINGDKFSGVTFHFVNEKVDDGVVVIQKKAKILLSDTAYSLLQRLDKLALRGFQELMNLICENNVPIRINKNHISLVNSKKEFEKLKHINLNTKGRFKDFFDLIRGLTFNPEKPICYFQDKQNGRKYGISIIIKQLNHDSIQ